MAERETREQAQERILVLQAELMERLEKNPKYKELDGVILNNGHYAQQDLIDNLMPQLFDPKYEIQQLLRSIQLNKFFIKFYNQMAIKMPEQSEECAENINLLKQFIRNDILEIQRIKRGDFEWVIK